MHGKLTPEKPRPSKVKHMLEELFKFYMSTFESIPSKHFTYDISTKCTSYNGDGPFLPISVPVEI